jgi:hypothetical protein
MWVCVVLLRCNHGSGMVLYGSILYGMCCVDYRPKIAHDRTTIGHPRRIIGFGGPTNHIFAFCGFSWSPLARSEKGSTTSPFWLFVGCLAGPRRGIHGSVKGVPELDPIHKPDMHTPAGDDSPASFTPMMHRPTIAYAERWTGQQ